MKIQIINYEGLDKNLSEEKFIINKISKPLSLDEYDINIIDLRSSELWKNDNHNYNSINCINDFINLKIMIENTKKTNIILVFPQDNYFKYGKSYDSGKSRYIYIRNIELKNMLTEVKIDIIHKLMPNSIQINIYDLKYENTTTIIEDKKFIAAFYFTDLNNILTTSRISEKNTTIKASERLFFTTLNIFEETEHVITFINKCCIKREIYPQWLIDYPVLDDDMQNEIIKNNTNIINELKNKVENANNIINENLEIKSILFTNEGDLIKTVFTIIEKILNVDLSTFIDSKKEDFLISINDNLEFIGEIKGVSSNIKNEHISQLDVHYQSRLDVLKDINTIKKVKAILIINPLRTTPINERKPVHNDQIILAKRNGSLIIETKILLKIFELFSYNKISSSECIELFNNEIGLLTHDIIEKYVKRN
ncbi:MAG: hypothetical protein FWD90_10010 [Defluviitaleaceae bacterium]|nr:hypothetical protein [Defluviitaleaceae bacterium]